MENSTPSFKIVSKNMNLKKQTIGGVKWTGLSSILVAVFQLCQVIVLTNFLEPRDFGLMAITSVVIGFSSLFMDMGISGAIIHRQDITSKQLSSLYWLNVASGILLSCSIYFLSPVVSNFYEEPKLGELLQLLSISFFLSSLGNQFRVLKQKHLQFDRIAKIDIFSSAVALSVAIGCAVSGLGIYSLVFSSLTNVAISSFLFMLIGLNDHRPLFRFCIKDLNGFVTFGLFRMGEKSINYFNSQFDVILIGKLLGAESLGIYNIAKTLVVKPASIINPIVTKVAFPIMARVQADNEKLKRIYLKSLNILCCINFPIYMVLLILAEPLILNIFGVDWVESIVIMQILCVYFMFRSTINPIGSLQLAKGRADLGFYWNSGLFIFIPITIFFGSLSKLEGVAISLVFLQLILMVPVWYFLVRPLCLATFRDYFINIFLPLFMSSISVVISLLVYYIPSYSVLLSSSLFLLSTFISYLILFRLLNRELWFEVVSIVKSTLNIV